jgi:hypothetical protein
VSESNAIEKLPRVAAIATLASRVETFQKVLPVIRAQVDHVFVYLDGYSTAPSFLKNYDHVTTRRAEDVGNLHCSSRFLCLQDLKIPTVVVMVDDDIIYPPDYVDRLIAVLHRVKGKAIVGVHGRIFVPPHRSYVKDVLTLHFSRQLVQPCHVHELGIGTCAFVSSHLSIDAREWDCHDMDDIAVAIDAQRQGVPRIAIARAAGWLRPCAEPQSDTLWNRILIDESEPSRRMRTLLSLYI